MYTGIDTQLLVSAYTQLFNQVIKASIKSRLVVQYCKSYKYCERRPGRSGPPISTTEEWRTEEKEKKKGAGARSERWAFLGVIEERVFRPARRRGVAPF